MGLAPIRFGEHELAWESSSGDQDGGKPHPIATNLRKRDDKRGSI
jgi:hypothetical protein